MSKKKGPTFKNIHIEGFGIGVSMPADAPAEFDTISIKGCSTAIELRDPPSLFEALGLPKDTPPVLLIEALNLLSDNVSSSTEEKENTLSQSRLVKWLGSGANIATITQGLTQFQQSSIGNVATTFLRSLAP
jgi:hypothetical protein